MKMNINGKVFDCLKKSEGKPVARYNTLRCAYEKPSVTKIELWNAWCKWFREASESAYDWIAIGSRNCFMFTIVGVITVDGVEHNFLITKTRQELH